MEEQNRNIETEIVGRGESEKKREGGRERRGLAELAGGSVLHNGRKFPTAKSAPQPSLQGQVIMAAPYDLPKCLLALLLGRRPFHLSVTRARGDDRCSVPLLPARAQGERQTERRPLGA